MSPQRGPRSAALALFAALLLPSAAAAQDPAAKGEDKPLPKDPYTGGDTAAMAAAGIVSYAPFPWADGFTTATIDEVLGEGRVLWIETAHFRIGSTFGPIPLPEDQQKRKALLDELKALHKKLPKVPERPKKLDPWLRAHLYAQRLETLYADVQQLLGVTDADFPPKGPQMREGRYLGMPDKYLLLLFQKKADLARYGERFCGQPQPTTFRWFHTKSWQLLAGIAAEGFEGFDETGLHGHVVYATTHLLCDGYNGYFYQLPLWLSEGIAHWFARKVPSDVVNCQIHDDEAVAEDKQNDWPVKVRRRAQHEVDWFRFAQIVEWTTFDQMGYHAHAQAWSRIDYLMQDRGKLGQLLRELKSLPPPTEGKTSPGEVAVKAQKLLADVYGLDAADFDEKWRAWVLKTYPKK